MRNRAALLLLPLLAACAQTPRPVETPPSGPLPPPASRPVETAPPTAQFIPPPIMREAGLEPIIGADIRAVVRAFGTPRLQVTEGDARKLQWAGEECVLDIYLYPLQPGAEPAATWVEARRHSDGRAVDRVECAAALQAASR